MAEMLEFYVGPPSTEEIRIGSDGPTDAEKWVQFGCSPNSFQFHATGPATPLVIQQQGVEWMRITAEGEILLRDSRTGAMRPLNLSAPARAELLRALSDWMKG